MDTALKGEVGGKGRGREPQSMVFPCLEAWPEARLLCELRRSGDVLAGPSRPEPAMLPSQSTTHLVVLDTLHGELVTVHPQGIAEDG